MKLATRYLLAVGAVLLSAAAILVFIVDSQMRRQTLEEAEHKARIIIDRNIATHTYFSHQLKPKVFELLDQLDLPGYFEPSWMSSTYAVRGIDNIFKGISESSYYYKECAVNARNPQNEADSYEKEFIEQINADKTLQLKTGVREIKGKKLYVVLRRGEVMEKACLRCHSTPQAAPSEMVNIFGAERSFNRHEGEVVSAISIRIPLDQAFAGADRFTKNLALGIAGVLLAVGLLIWILNQLLFAKPLERMRKQTTRITLEEGHLGEQLEPDFPGEWNLLARDFNKMSSELGETYEGLEKTVDQRTAQLQKALDQVNTLRGLLPICANCKKIRDDEGNWHQVEKYIRQHSEAEFSHGICPECLAKLYPDKGNG